MTSLKHSKYVWPWVKIQIVLPVNIPIPPKIGSKRGGEFTYQNGIIGFDNSHFPRAIPNEDMNIDDLRGAKLGASVVALALRLRTVTSVTSVRMLKSNPKPVDAAHRKSSIRTVLSETPACCGNCKLLRLRTMPICETPPHRLPLLAASHSLRTFTIDLRLSRRCEQWGK